MEIWKDIVGYEGLYQVSNKGNGRSLDRTVERMSRWGKPVKVTYKGKELAKNKIGNGYLRFDLCKDGEYDYRYIHQLVWETFVGKIPEGLEIDHIDTDRTNNRLDNLRVTDRKGNMRNPLTYAKFFVPCSEEKKKKLSSTSKGKHYSPNTEFKKGHPSAFKGHHHSKENKEFLKKILSKRVDQINRITGEVVNSYESAKIAAEMLGIKISGISNCANGRFPHYKGFIWRKHQRSEVGCE